MGSLSLHGLHGKFGQEWSQHSRYQGKIIRNNYSQQEFQILTLYNVKTENINFYYKREFLWINNTPKIICLQRTQQKLLLLVEYAQLSITEWLKGKCSQIQILLKLKQIVKTVSALSKKFGPFIVTQKMLRINSIENLVIWYNEKFGQNLIQLPLKNDDSAQKIMIQNIVEIFRVNCPYFFSPQWAQLKSFQETENLIDTVKENLTVSLRKIPSGSDSDRLLSQYLSSNSQISNIDFKRKQLEQFSFKKRLGFTTIQNEPLKKFRHVRTLSSLTDNSEQRTKMLQNSQRRKQSLQEKIQLNQQDILTPISAKKKQETQIHIFKGTSKKKLAHSIQKTLQKQENNLNTKNVQETTGYRSADSFNSMKAFSLKSTTGTFRRTGQFEETLKRIVYQQKQTIKEESDQTHKFSGDCSIKQSVTLSQDLNNLFSPKSSIMDHLEDSTRAKQFQSVLFNDF